MVYVAQELLQNPQFKFVVVGDGQEREDVLALANAMGVLNKNFFYHSAIPKQEIARFMSAVDVATSLFLPIPEMEANSANKFFDALGAGCAVAINYGGWQRELLDTTGAGIGLSADPKRGAMELESFASDRVRIENSGLIARQLAETEFSRDVLADQLERILVSSLRTCSHKL